MCMLYCIYVYVILYICVCYIVYMCMLYCIYVYVILYICVFWITYMCIQYRTVYALNTILLMLNHALCVIYRILCMQSNL